MIFNLLYTKLYINLFVLEKGVQALWSCHLAPIAAQT